MAGTAPIWLLVATVAIYGAFTIAYGETIFDVSFDECTGIISCAEVVFQFIGVVFAFVTLGGFDSPLPALLQPILLLFFGVGWGLYVYSMITDAIP